MANNISREQLINQISNGKVSVSKATVLFNTLDSAGIKISKDGDADMLYKELFGDTKETRKEWKSSDQIYDFWHADIYEKMAEAQQEINLDLQLGEWSTHDQLLQEQLNEAFDILEQIAPWH